MIKQLSSNLIYFYLSIFLQFENIDLQYKINIESLALGLISTLFCSYLLYYFNIKVHTSFERILKLKKRYRKLYFIKYESKYIKLNLKNWFLKSYQLYCSLRKIIFVFVIICCFYSPLTSLILIII